LVAQASIPHTLSARIGGPTPSAAREGSVELTKISKLFVQEIAARLENVEVINDMVIISPTRHIARGFLLEQTPVKDRFYFWAMVIPLFSPTMKGLSLNYSNRVSFGYLGKIPILIEGDRTPIVNMVIDAILPGILQSLSRIAEPKDFLNEFEDRGYERENIILEFAIAHILSGDVAKGKKLLTDILTRPAPEYHVPRVQEAWRATLFASQEEAHKVLDAVDHGIESFDEMVSTIEQHNIQNHFSGMTISK
jgi:hypothetical protein